MRILEKRQRPLAGGRRAEQFETGLQDRIAVPAAEQDGVRKAPYFDEVMARLQSGKNPNLYIYAVGHSWERAKRRREAKGPGTASVLPDDVSPLDLRWPSVSDSLVAWPDDRDVPRKIELAQALIRDGAELVYIEHSPEWIRAKAIA